MSENPRAGAEDPLPATLGGAAWRPRAATHAEEVARGERWALVGCNSEVAPLRAVMLAVPGEELRYSASPDEMLMLERPDLDALRLEWQAIETFYRSQGVEVHLCRPPVPPPPNFLFMRDLFFMTPEGAVLARMAAEQRAGEERHAALGLAGLGVPVLMTPRDRATFEGADALWLNEQTVLLGLGRRTNREGCRQLAGLMVDLGVHVLPVELPPGVQHLLGVCNFVDRDLAVVDEARLPAALDAILERHGVKTLRLQPCDELARGRAMNFVTLGPRRLVMPAGCPATRARYEAAGLECHELEVTQVLRAAGALGCLTGILRRAW